MLSRLYGAVAAQRRRWYQREPSRRRRLTRPVVSVGGLSIGGSGKTPIAAQVAATLCAMGERPAVLSRGYGRTHRVDGVVVVRDARAIRAGLAEAGDEPLMLARLLPGIAVLVSDDRYLAGRLAETRLGATVHVLDDGFQHLPLHRDADLVVIGEHDLDSVVTLPGGRLREPVEAARVADALVVETSDPDRARDVASRFDVPAVFRYRRLLHQPRDAETRKEVVVPPEARLVALAGIARPPAFFAALRSAGYSVVNTLSFRDHHPFTADDIAHIDRLAGKTHADYVVTTDKDLERLLPHAPFPFRLLAVRLAVAVEPPGALRDWLGRALAGPDRGQPRGAHP